MGKSVPISMAIFVMLGILVGCVRNTNAESVPDGLISTFEGVITELSDDEIRVRAFKDEQSFPNGLFSIHPGQLQVPLYDDVQIGDNVIVSWSGGIMESHPATL